LDPGPSLPQAYFKFSEDPLTPGILVKNVHEEKVEKNAPVVPTPPPPELVKAKTLTKRQKKEVFFLTALFGCR
jgi:hypothetical protein